MDEKFSLRLFSIMLFAMFLSCLPNQAYAWNSEFGEQPHHNVVIENEENVIQAFNKAYEACMNYQEEDTVIRVDVSEFELTAEQKYKTQYLLHSNGELFWINTYNDNNFKGDVFTIPLRYNKNTIDSMREELEAEIEKVIALIPNDSNDETKVRIIHDYILKTASYSKGISAYDCLVSHQSNCFGYTHTFDMLAHRVGLEDVLAYSDYIDHVWNVVCVDGNWLHIDCTWDDSSSKHYKYYLLSDSEIDSNGHTAWFTYHECLNSYKIEEYLPGRNEVEVYTPPAVVEPQLQPQPPAIEDDPKSDDETDNGGVEEESEDEQIDEGGAGSDVSNDDIESIPGNAYDQNESDGGNKIDISDAKIAIVGDSFDYNGRYITPSIKVYLNDSLVDQSNYNISYKNNKNAGKAYITVHGINEFVGQKTIGFKINKIDPVIVVKNKSFSISKNKAKKTCSLNPCIKTSSKSELKFKIISRNSKKISISKDGKILLKKGSYKPGKIFTLTVKITSCGSDNYNKKIITKKFKVQMKR